MDFAEDSVEHRIFTIDDINEETSADVVEFIHMLNKIDDDLEDLVVGHERKPITLLFQSFGGKIYCALAIIGAIEMSNTPVYGIALGPIFSAGFFIFVACDARSAHRLAVFGYHDMGVDVKGKIKEVKDDLIPYEHMTNQLDKLITDNTKITAARLKKVRKDKEEWMIFADEALKLGVIHEIC